MTKTFLGTLVEAAVICGKNREKSMVFRFNCGTPNTSINVGSKYGAIFRNYQAVKNGAIVKLLHEPLQNMLQSYFLYFSGTKEFLNVSAEFWVDQFT